MEAIGSKISFHNKKGPSNFPILEFAHLMMMMTVMMMMMAGQHTRSIVVAWSDVSYMNM